jgi:RNA polymerase sigma-70 factor (ECF subfamily)
MLAASAHEGSAARLTAIVRAEHGFVWRTVRRLGLPESAADDAAQQVFIVLASKLAGIALGAERAFLYRTAYHVALDARKKHVRRIDRSAAEPTAIAEAADPNPTPERALEEAEARQMLEEILDALPDDLRTVFVLFELEGLTIPEVAALIETPVGTAASRLRRARALFEGASERARKRRKEGTR